MTESEYMTGYAQSFISTMGSQTSKENAVIVCVQGGIGCGKSSVLNELQQMGQTVVNEGIDNNKWSLWNKYKSDPLRYTFAFQMQVVFDLIDTIERSIEENNGGYIFVERSPDAALIFTKAAMINGYVDPEEYKMTERIINEAKERLRNKYPSIKFVDVLFECEIDIQMSRIHERSRSGEEEITKEYTQQMNTMFHDTYTDCRVFNTTHRTPNQLALDLFNLV